MADLVGCFSCFSAYCFLTIKNIKLKIQLDIFIRYRAMTVKRLASFWVARFDMTQASAWVWSPPLTQIRGSLGLWTVTVGQSNKQQTTKQKEPKTIALYSRSPGLLL